MSLEAKQGFKFDFRKSLKEDSRYPILNYFRVERYFTRPLAALVVRALINTRVTPNQVTLFSFFLGICSGVFFCGGDSRYFIVGGILAQLSSIFDCADGMLARARDRCSAYGAYLDLFLDRIVDFVMLVGASTGYFIYSGDLTMYIACLLGIGLFFLQLSLYYLTRIYKKNMSTGAAAEARGLMIFLVLAFSLANRLDLLGYIFMFAAVSSTIIKIINLARASKSDA
jgi:phosphatidylglycerophosphate synthase